MPAGGAVQPGRKASDCETSTVVQGVLDLGGHCASPALQLPVYSMVCSMLQAVSHLGFVWAE